MKNMFRNIIRKILESDLTEPLTYFFGFIIALFLVIVYTNKDYKTTESTKTAIQLQGYVIQSNNRIEVFTKDTVYIIELLDKKEVNQSIIKGVK